MLDKKFLLEDIKKTITSLRQQFAHEKNKIKIVLHSGMGMDEVYEPSVWWYEKLQFLIPFVKTRKTTSSLDSLREDNKTVSQEYEILDTDSVSGDATTDSAVPSTSNDAIPQNRVTKNNSKRRKTQESETDPIITQTVTTLKALESKLQGSVKTNLQVFGEYITSELQNVHDEDLINNAQHEISNVIYQTKRSWIKMKKEREERDNTYQFVFEEDQ